MLHYLISGLVVASEITLTGVADPEKTGLEPDVRIERGRLPETLDQVTLRGPNWMISGDDFLLHIPGVARMRVRSGREIIVDVENAEADTVPFLLGTGFGVLLHQRGTLALHASAVARDGRAIAICGPSGMGKSTLSAALCQAGCSFVSDDISVVRFEADGCPWVLPDSRQHRLWIDAVERLSLSQRQGGAVRETIEKYHVDPSGESAAMPLSKILVLRTAESRGQEAVIEPLGLSDAAALLRSDVYRSALASRMELDAALFGQIARLLGHVSAYRLTRPQEIEKLEEVVTLVQKHLFEAC